MLITKKDIFWNYGATFLKIASSTLLLPFILRMMPTEIIGIWSIFMTITAFASLLDFGFNPSFTRNVSYIFSGVKTLRITGLETIDDKDLQIDYGLLKGVIKSMRWFYSRIALLLFSLLMTLGTFYIYTLLQNYKSNHQEIYVAWFLLCIINTYNLFTLYYDALLQGKGLIKRSKQIVIIGQIVYLIIAMVLILAGKGLVAIVSAQAFSVVIIRWLSYHSFFTTEIKENLNLAIARTKKEIINAIYPNAMKIGLTTLGAFLVQKSAIVIGSLYLPLRDIASYGITMQLITLISALSGIYIATYFPKIAQLRVVQNNHAVKELYLKGQVVLLLTYVAGGLGLLILGNLAITGIGSKTSLMSPAMILIALIVSFLGNNHSMAGEILLSKNEVPFFKAALMSGGATVFLLLLFFQFSNIGLWAMILAQGIAQGVYQNWKWPIVVIRELEITQQDAFKAFSQIIGPQPK